MFCVADTLSEAAGRIRAVDELREVVEEDRVNFRERLERTDSAIAGINATLAVLQQLMRDRNCLRQRIASTPETG